MSLTAYQQLQQQGNVGGVHLPALTPAVLKRDSKVLTIEQAIEQIHAFDPQSGWVMYRDGITLGLPASERYDVVEGEWCRNNNTMTLKHLDSDRYLLVRLTVAEGDSATATQCYSEQTVLLRPSLAKNQPKAVYRLWWQLGGQGVAQGLWQPLAQQFVGFIEEVQA